MTVAQAVIDFMAETLKKSGLIVMTPREFLLALLKPSDANRDGWMSVRRIEEEFVRYELLPEQARVLLDKLKQEELVEYCLVDKQGVSTPSYRRKLRSSR